MGACECAVGVCVGVYVVCGEWVCVCTECESEGVWVCVVCGEWV